MDRIERLQNDLVNEMSKDRARKIHALLLSRLESLLEKGKLKHMPKNMDYFMKSRVTKIEVEGDPFKKLVLDYDENSDDHTIILEFTDWESSWPEISNDLEKGVKVESTMYFRYR